MVLPGSCVFFLIYILIMSVAGACGQDRVPALAEVRQLERNRWGAGMYL